MPGLVDVRKRPGAKARFFPLSHWKLNIFPLLTLDICQYSYFCPNSLLNSRLLEVQQCLLKGGYVAGLWSDSYPVKYDEIRTSCNLAWCGDLALRIEVEKNIPRIKENRIKYLDF